jgi:hypothetical protein
MLRLPAKRLIELRVQSDLEISQISPAGPQCQRETLPALGWAQSHILPRPAKSQHSRIAMLSPSQQIMRLGFGFAVSQALRVIIELGIPDLLAVGKKSVDDLAVATQSNADALYRVMRLLAPEGLFREVQPRHFELTEVGAVLRSDRAGPRDFVHMANSEAYLAFEQLLYSVRTGLARN